MSGTAPRPAPEARSPRISAETLYALLLVLLLGGLAASLYAAYEVVNPAAAAVCSTSGYVSCSKVQSSGDTQVLGVPDWAVGVGGYVVMLLVGVLAYRTFDRRYLSLLLGLSGIGLLFSLFFVYEETVVIQALCPVCSTAHALNVGVLIVALTLWRMGRPAEDGPGSPGTGRPSAP